VRNSRHECHIFAYVLCFLEAHADNSQRELHSISWESGILVHQVLNKDESAGLLASLLSGGSWYNELGSVLQLQQDDQGFLTGTYITGTHPEWGAFPVAGRYDLHQQASKGITLGFVVNWQNSTHVAYSSTSWSGQCIMGKDGPEIFSMWLLSSSTDEADEWGSIQVGQDIFNPQPYTANATAQRTCSHPRKMTRR